MEYFFITFGVMISVIAMMAVGVIFGNIIIKGSCGGLGKITGDSCQFCKDDDECKHESSIPKLDITVDFKDYSPSNKTAPINY